MRNSKQREYVSRRQKCYKKIRPAKFMEMASYRRLYLLSEAENCYLLFRLILTSSVKISNQILSQKNVQIIKFLEARFLENS